MIVRQIRHDLKNRNGPEAKLTETPYYWDEKLLRQNFTKERKKMYFYIFKFSIVRLVGIKGNNNLENVQ